LFTVDNYYNNRHNDYNNNYELINDENYVNLYADKEANIGK